MDETANSGRRVVTDGEHNDGINNARSTWEVLGTHNNITILFLCIYNGVRREQMIYKYTVQRRPLWIYGAGIESTAADDLFRLRVGEKK